jgi:hypothetical protein
MAKCRNYWTYSVGCFVVWAVVLVLTGNKGNHLTRHNILLVFGGWTVAWISTTIARFVYPPPKRWLRANLPTP